MSKPTTAAPRITRANPNRPLRMVIYGTPGVGKTTFAAQAEAPIVLPVEDGLGMIEVDHFDKPESLDDVTNSLRWLAGDQHGYRTLIIDTADALEPIIHAKVIETIPKDTSDRASSIEDYGYGKGYVHAANEMRKLTAAFDFLRAERGMNVIIVAHAKISKMTPPDGEGYDRWNIKLNDKAGSVLTEWADVIGFASFEKRMAKTKGPMGKDRAIALGDGGRILRVEERPSFVAKNRFALPGQMPLDWATFHEALIEARKQKPNTQAATS